MCSYGVAYEGDPCAAMHPRGMHNRADVRVSSMCAVVQPLLLNQNLSLKAGSGVLKGWIRCAQCWLSRGLVQTRRAVAGLGPPPCLRTVALGGGGDRRQWPTFALAPAAYRGAGGGIGQATGRL